MVGAAVSALTREASLIQIVLYRKVPLYLHAFSLKCLTPLEVNKPVEVVRLKRNNLHITLLSKLCRIRTYVRTYMYVCIVC